MKNDVHIHSESTPNPRTMKFVVDQQIAQDSAEMKTADEAQRSPLASKLFGFPWMESIFVGPNFVSITKQDWVDWGVLEDPLKGLIKEHIDEGLPVLLDPQELQSSSSSAISEDDSEDVKKIKTILENEIRPAVAMDGGDVSFAKYEDRKVYLVMKGACSGCPSSTYTLRVGIESRLREAVPEIEEVVAV